MCGMQSAIVVEDLRKCFASRVALAGVSLNVGRGEIVGLLGPNGAGKSTALAVLATLLPPEQGTVIVAGHRLPREARAARRALGFVPQDPALYPPLTGNENLHLFARMLGLRERESRAAAAHALALVGLTERGDDPVATYSGGMRRRLNLAVGVLHAPEVLLLDEPTAGVDPQSRERLYEAIEELARGGTAILTSTHDMEEAERLCARIYLLDAGRLVATGTPEDLVTQTGMASSLFLRTLRPPPPHWLDGLGSVRVIAANGTTSTLAVDDPAAVPVVLARAARAGGDVLEMRFDRPTLADAFFALTGHALRDGANGAGPAGNA